MAGKSLNFLTHLDVKNFESIALFLERLKMDEELEIVPQKFCDNGNSTDQKNNINTNSSSNSATNKNNQQNTLVLWKNRFSDSFNASIKSGGYRDIQIALRIKTKEAVLKELDQHICEIQLHHDLIWKCKSGEGHKIYVVGRNLRGE